MMAASVLWLLRLAGPARRGRALGHIGLANYAGLAVGPLLAQPLGGADHVSRVFAVAAGLPCAGLVLVGLLPDHADAPAMHVEAKDQVQRGSVMPAVLLPGSGLALVNFGYVSLLSFGATTARAHGVGGGALVVPVFATAVILARTVGASFNIAAASSDARRQPVPVPFLSRCRSAARCRRPDSGPDPDLRRRANRG